MVFGYVLLEYPVEFSAKKLRVGFFIASVQPLKENISASGADPRNISFAIRATLAIQNKHRMHCRSDLPLSWLSLKWRSDVLR